MCEITDFKSDIYNGKTGEVIFKEDFLDFLHIKYKDVTGCHQYQIIDSDFVTKIGTYEIKMSYKDNKKIIIEEYTNINIDLCPISFGWFYKTKADLIVFISKKTRTMVLLPLTSGFKEHYHCIKDNYELIRNRISSFNGNKWQSAFRVIPLSSITGYYSFYKKIL